ncbi:hypothetical protein P8452_16073 [Trifolium repens]|nr:hypothetical protein P8452_16073 [Trifolium repens]
MGVWWSRWDAVQRIPVLCWGGVVLMVVVRWLRCYGHVVESWCFGGSWFLPCWFVVDTVRKGPLVYLIL